MGIRTTHLRVKIRSLAEEARIIRHEERRAKAARRHDLTRSLAEHRRDVVRRESRCSQLAYAFLRGRAYRDVEAVARNAPDWSRVTTIALSFGESRDRPTVLNAIGEWAKS